MEVTTKRFDEALFNFVYFLLFSPYFLVSEIPNPPEHYNGKVNMRDFWEAVTREMLSRGFYPCKCIVYCASIDMYYFVIAGQTSRQLFDSPGKLVPLNQ